MNTLSIYQLLKEEIQKAKFTCPVEIEYDLNDELKNYFLYTPALDLKEGDESRLPVGFIACPEMNKVIQVPSDVAHFYVNRYKYIQDKNELNDDDLRIFISRTVRHEKRHEEQFHWLRDHNVPADMWYFDDDISYGEGNMEKDANAAAMGIDYDLDLYMSKYLSELDDKIIVALKGIGKTLMKGNKASCIIGAKLLLWVGIGYFVKKILK